jgi:hypothetical protein
MQSHRARDVLSANLAKVKLLGFIIELSSVKDDDGHDLAASDSVGHKITCSFELYPVNMLGM